MLQLGDRNGIVQDPKQYMDRIRLLTDQKQAIVVYVAQLEVKLNACQPNIAEDQSRWYPDQFRSLMEEFLMTATYAANLIGESFQPNTTTRQQMFDFWDGWLSLSSNVNTDSYNLEKMVRLGLGDILRMRGEALYKPGDIVCIEREEERLYVAGQSIYKMTEEEMQKYIPDYKQPALLIKMLGRHNVLGLPPLDEEKKKNLEKVLLTGALYDNWASCSALRAGLQLPPILADFVDNQIKMWVEHDPKALPVFILGQMDQATAQDFLSKRFLSTVHHLHRLFGLST